MKKKLYLFRHGETDWNTCQKMQGQADIPLNSTGIKQAKKCAEFLKDKGIEIIYSSPLSRAIKTAEALSNITGVKIKLDENLKEMNFGDYDGSKIDDAIATIGENTFYKFRDSKNELLDMSYPNGETKRQVRDRFLKAILNICKNEEKNVIGISAHGRILREFLFNNDFSGIFSTLKNCECIEAEYEDNKIKIIKRIDTQN